MRAMDVESGNGRSDQPGAGMGGGFAKYMRYLMLPIAVLIVFHIASTDYRSETRDALGDQAELVLPSTTEERVEKAQAAQAQYAQLLSNVSTLMEQHLHLLEDVRELKTMLQHHLAAVDPTGGEQKLS